MVISQGQNKENTGPRGCIDATGVIIAGGILNRAVIRPTNQAEANHRSVSHCVVVRKRRGHRHR